MKKKSKIVILLSVVLIIIIITQSSTIDTFSSLRLVSPASYRVVNYPIMYNVLPDGEDDQGWRLRRDEVVAPIPAFSEGDTIHQMDVSIVELGHYGNRISLRLVRPDGSTTSWRRGTKEWRYNVWPDYEGIFITINERLNQEGWWRFEMIQEERGGTLGGTPGWTTNYVNNNLIFFVGDPVTCYRCRDYKLETRKFNDFECPDGWSSNILDCTPPALKFTIRDSSTNLWLAGVSISIGETVKLTNHMGQAVFNLVPGMYMVNITRGGYNPLLNIPYEKLHTDEEQTLLMIQMAPEPEPEEPEPELEPPEEPEPELEPEEPEPELESIVTIKVKQSGVSPHSDDSSIASARVELAGIVRATDANGFARFQVTTGVYPLEISKVGYVTHVDEVHIAMDRYIEIALMRDTAPPDTPPTPETGPPLETPGFGLFFFIGAIFVVLALFKKKIKT